MQSINGDKAVRLSDWQIVNDRLDKKSNRVEKRHLTAFSNVDIVMTYAIIRLVLSAGSLKECLIRELGDKEALSDSFMSRSGF